MKEKEYFGNDAIVNLSNLHNIRKKILALMLGIPEFEFQFITYQLCVTQSKL